MTPDIADVASAMDPLTRRFSAAGHSLFLVGGVVRDLALGNHGFADDIDCTTDARPDTIRRLVEPVATAVWTQGERFGTIGATVSGRAVEITTHRAESYDPSSRKPVVAFGDDLVTDLSRRDFTINAMAIDLADGDLHDPFHGRDDLVAGRLTTPLDPSISFSDDPLRMLRAARFAARFHLTIVPDVIEAARDLHGRIGIVSVERIHDELERLLALSNPGPGLRFLFDVGLFAEFGPDVGPDGLRVAIERAGASSPVAGRPLTNTARRALLLSSAETSVAASWLASMRYSTDHVRTTRAVLAGVDLLIDAGAPDDAADARAIVRRLVDRVGLEHMATLFDVIVCIESSPSPWAVVYEQLVRTEDLSRFDPPIGGGELMSELGLTPGPVVGELINRLRAHRIAHGPFTRDEALALASGWMKS